MPDVFFMGVVGVAAVYSRYGLENADKNKKLAALWLRICQDEVLPHVPRPHFSPRVE